MDKTYSILSTIDTVETQRRLAEAGITVDKHIFRVSCNLRGLANSALAIPAGTNINVASVTQGSSAVPIGWNESSANLFHTSHTGTANQFSNDHFVMLRRGVRVWSTNAPSVNTQIEQRLAVGRKVGSQSTVLWMARELPCADYGVRSPSLAGNATGIVSYEQNGGIAMPELDPSDRIVFTEGKEIGIFFHATQPIYLTTDGLPWNTITFGAEGSNALDPDLPQVVEWIMEGRKVGDLTRLTGSI